MLKDIRIHGAVTQDIDFYATLAGEKLISAPFYEIKEGKSGKVASFFLAGMYFHLDGKGLAFSGTGGSVSEYMFGSPMPLQDLSHKEVKNRLVFFGTFQGDKGLTFSSQTSGFQSYDDLFLNGNALSNSFFLVKVPWAYSVRRTQEILLKTLGRVLKRSEQPGSGDDSALESEILRELAEPEATLLLLRLVHRPHQRFFQFLRSYYRKVKEWGDAQEQFVAPLAEELGVAQYQRERIAVDILYKDDRNRQVVDEYKDVLLQLTANTDSPSAVARLNSLRNLAMRHGLPPSLFDTLDGLIPTTQPKAAREPQYLRRTREIFEGLFLSSRPPSEVIGPAEVAELLSYKQKAQQRRDNGFEQVLLETGRILDERAAEGTGLDAFEVFSEVVTYFDRLDNAEALINQLAFMEGATATEDKVRSGLGNKRALDGIEKNLFYRMVLRPVLQNPYALHFGRLKAVALYEGLEQIERGDRTLSEIASELEELGLQESAQHHLYEGIRDRLKKSYFDLSNSAHVRLLQREVEGELVKRGEWKGPIPQGSFAAALEELKSESEFLNNVLPRAIENGDSSYMEAFRCRSGLDLFRLEELEREYKAGLDPDGATGNTGPGPGP